MSPTQRTLAEMRKRGYLAAVTERWNAFARIRQDLWGFCDVLCVGDDGVIAVQCTSADNVSSRIRKIEESEHLATVRRAGVRVLVHGWKKGRNGRYALREVDIS